MINASATFLQKGLDFFRQKRTLISLARVPDAL
jgi:hypothetical protein